MHKIMNAIPGRGGLRIMVLMLAAVVWLTGCAPDEQADVATSPAAAELPDWIERVHPAPGSDSSAAPQVQVAHGAVGVREGVRLMVNGTDVTEYSGPRPGVLAYDPNRPPAPVELDPGTHQATALRVRLNRIGKPHEVLDSVRWEFAIQ